MLKKMLISLVVVLLLLVAGSFFFLNAAVKKGVETFVPKMTKTSVAVGGVKLSPFSGKGEISDLVIGNPAGYETPSSFKLTSVKIHLSPMSLLSDQIVIHDIIIDGPEVTYELKGISSNNIKQIMENIKEFAGAADKAPAPEAEEPGAAPVKKKVRIEHFLFTNARVHLSASMLKGKKASVPMPTIELKDIGDQSLGETISQIQQSLWNGIKEAVVGLKGQVTGAGGNLVEGVKGLFGN
jgi:hypothetical protein